ncbi:sulfatase [Paraburkholderia silviterrae]|uniref:Sulfatase n=1 Tax=Paraburkholderia silviterrae TaxID=2528715 RepID=A0A4R5M6T3_9BURK|nr:sulfatase-like hydrolase/transferase [Paraburkholderia silviterrae]TDG21306.1 sulfatase [Paraburkholderia silviterrae]
MQSTPRQPNFLIIVTDQHRADHLGAYGNKVVRTPHIDGLAAGGFRADAMYVATPICMPNRASMLTGRYPSAHGARHNGIALSTQATTFVDLLREAGYSTGLVGKAHFQNMTDHPAQWPLRAEERLSREAFEAPLGRYDQERRDLWLGRDDFDLDYPFYGFETVDLVDDHADIVHGHYRYWLRKHYPEVEALLGPEQAIAAPEYELTRIGQAWRTRVPEALHPTAYIADRAIEQLQRHAGATKPFFLAVSFPDPHHPFTPPGKYWDMYSPDEIALPASFNVTGEPPHVSWLKEKRRNGTAVKHTPALFSCSEREAREAISLNYGSITHIDDNVGRLLHELTRLGLDKDTIVIFTSDHGDYLGDHGLMLKGPIHYQGLIRVPFIWRDPRVTRHLTHSASLTSTVDLAPTILERAGVAPFNGIQGKSMLGLMGGADASLRDALMIEEEGQRVMMGFKERIRCRTLLDGQCRLTLYDGVQWGELYDLDADPLEMRNLWDSAAHAGPRARMLESLARTMLENVDKSPYPSALA